MRRPLVIAILCVSLLTVGAVAVWVVPRLSGWTPFWAGPPAPIPAAPPFVPQAELPQSGALEIVRGNGAVSEAQVEQAWQPVSQAATQGEWEAWTLVADATTGDIIFERDGETPHTPASLMKVLTAYAALSALDPRERLETGVSQDGADLYLWGEGDLMLSVGPSSASRVNGHAGLATLAEEVAKGVADSDQAFTLHYQGSLFPGPARSAALYDQNVTRWIGEVAPFAIDTGRLQPGEYGYHDDSAGKTAEAFRGLLEEEGIEVASISFFYPPVPEGARVVGTVESARVLDQVRVMVEDSDNTLAEQYCRLAASRILGHPAGLGEATATLTEILSDSGVDTTGLRVADCSGLDEDSRVSAQTLLDTLTASLDAGSPTTSLTRILAVGGMSGTLSSRFTEDPFYGNVAGKTGSLGHVSALAALGTTASGQHLYIIAGADNVPDGGAWYVAPLIDDFVDGVLSY